jgi:hypothetical protein
MPWWIDAGHPDRAEQIEHWCRRAPELDAAIRAGSAAYPWLTICIDRGLCPDPNDQHLVPWELSWYAGDTPVDPLT